MEAMILAAGHGTRLRPLTLDVPKALVEVAGTPLLEHVARRLVRAGAERLIVNVSPHADQIRDFIEARDGFGVEVAVSEERDGPLETGGGLKKAAPLFDGDGPFVMHNADILTDFPIQDLLGRHRGEDALATLAVRAPETDRFLVFDEAGLLGYAYQGEVQRRREPVGETTEWDFCGVQALSPEIFDLLAEEERERFSIVPLYLRLAERGHRVVPHDIGDARWIDVGTHERLEEARRAVEAGGMI